MRYQTTRIDFDDGSIGYEIWDTREQRRIVRIDEDPVEYGSSPDRARARRDATLVVRALNAYDSQ